MLSMSAGLVVLVFCLDWFLLLGGFLERIKENMNTLTLNLGKNLQSALVDSLRDSFLLNASVEFSLAGVLLKITITSLKLTQNLSSGEWMLDLSFVQPYNLSSHEPFEPRPNIKGVDY